MAQRVPVLAYKKQKKVAPWHLLPWPASMATLQRETPHPPANPLHQRAVSCFNMKRQLARNNLSVVEIKRISQYKFKPSFFCIFLTYVNLNPSASIRWLWRHRPSLLSVLENFQPFPVISVLEQQQESL